MPHRWYAAESGSRCAGAEGAPRRACSHSCRSDATRACHFVRVTPAAPQFDLRLFTVVLFHYDGRVDGWADLPWASSAIHVRPQPTQQRFTDVTASRTLPAHRYPSSRSPSGGVRTSASLSVAFKLTPGSLRAALLCRFARRFLHPAVVSRYELLFVWDEDIGVSGFDANRRVLLAACCCSKLSSLVCLFSLCAHREQASGCADLCSSCWSTGSTSRSPLWVTGP